jgi:hypothetical protein
VRIPLFYHLSLFLILSFNFNSVFGQDKIFTKDKKQLDVKIVNEYDQAFNYTTNESDTVSILTIKKNRIRRIEFENGSVNQMGYQNPRKIMPLGFGIGYGFSKTVTYEHHFFTYSEQYITLITLSVDYFIIPQLELIATTGLDLNNSSGISYFTGGTNLHFNSWHSRAGITPFIGLTAGAVKQNYSGSGTAVIQINLGLNMLFRFGLNFTIQENLLPVFRTNSSLSEGHRAFTEIKIGWKFRIHSS